MSIISIITVRAGSKGLKNKCLKKIRGKPVFQYTVDYSLNLEHIMNNEFFTVVSTDSSDILRLCEENGITFIERDSALASDDARIEDVVYDAYLKIGRDFDFISLLLGNVPTRYPQEFLNAYEFLLEHQEYDCVLSMQNVEKFNPAWMYELDKDMLPMTRSTVYRRQDLKQHMIPDGHTILFRSARFIEFMQKNPKTSYMFEPFGDRIKPWLNNEVIIDIDTEKDFLFAEAFLSFKKDPAEEH